MQDFLGYSIKSKSYKCFKNTKKVEDCHLWIQMRTWMKKKVKYPDHERVVEDKSGKKKPQRLKIPCMYVYKQHPEIKLLMIIG